MLAIVTLRLNTTAELLGDGLSFYLVRIKEVFFVIAVVKVLLFLIIKWRQDFNRSCEFQCEAGQR